MKRSVLKTAAFIIAPILLAISGSEAPFLEAELIFPLEHWHNHASCIVQTPQGDLLVCWYHGSGERTADGLPAQKSIKHARFNEAWVIQGDTR